METINSYNADVVVACKTSCGDNSIAKLQMTMVL